MPDHFWPLALVDLFSLLIAAAVAIGHHSTRRFWQHLLMNLEDTYGRAPSPKLRGPGLMSPFEMAQYRYELAKSEEEERQIWLYDVGVHAVRYPVSILLSVIKFIVSCIAGWVLPTCRIELRIVQQAIEGNCCADVPDALVEGGSTPYPRQTRTTHDEPTRYAAERT